MFCSTCGKPVEGQGAFCMNCGSPVAVAPHPPKPAMSPLVITLIVIVALGLAGVLMVILIVGSVAIPKFRQAQMRAGEVGAIQNIRAIHVAEAQFHVEHQRYAGSLSELASRLPDDLASGTKSGYRFRLQASDAGYQIRADPLSSGRVFLYSDQTLVIRRVRGLNPAGPGRDPID